MMLLLAEMALEEHELGCFIAWGWMAASYEFWLYCIFMDENGTTLGCLRYSILMRYRLHYHMLY